MWSNSHVCRSYRGIAGRGGGGDLFGFSSWIGLSTFPIKGNPVFSNGPKSLPTNPPDCPIICNWVFYNFILAEELIAKALRSLETFVLVNNSLWGKLFSSLESPIKFDERFKVTSVPFFYCRFWLIKLQIRQLYI